VLGDIVARALDDVGQRSVTVCAPARLPEVVADPALMERVIVNLVRNALRYSPPGTLPLLAARAHGSRAELRVIDRGPGIPSAERDRAFLPFQRLGDTSTSPGVGLGLALSRGLTEAMGGTLDPHETPGGGLTMVISMPAARVAAREAAPPEPIGADRSDRAWCRFRIGADTALILRTMTMTMLAGRVPPGGSG
jgi:two-component system sensor histidine kinase KdpD